MNLYLIQQSANDDYDTYDSAVVVAENEEDAKKIHPSGMKFWNSKTMTRDLNWYQVAQVYNSWAYVLEDVNVTYLGVADNSLNAGEVVCSSFNAG